MNDNERIARIVRYMGEYAPEQPDLKMLSRLVDGRFCDHGIALEAASPREVKQGGAGCVIRAGYAASPFGEVLIAEGPRGIYHLSFAEGMQRLERDWPNAEIVRDDQRVEGLSLEIFKRASSRVFSLPLFVRGTEFQVKVWRALLHIPEGHLVSYGRLASFLGSPSAARAVGMAVGTNPIGFLIPCHRVIRETGEVGGYAWGTDRKKAIQAWEMFG